MPLEEPFDRGDPYGDVGTSSSQQLSTEAGTSSPTMTDLFYIL